MLSEAVQDLAAYVAHFAEWAGRLHGQAARDRALAQIGAALKTISGSKSARGPGRARLRWRDPRVPRFRLRASGPLFTAPK